MWSVNLEPVASPAWLKPKGRSISLAALVTATLSLGSPSTGWPATYMNENELCLNDFHFSLVAPNPYGMTQSRQVRTQA